MAAAVIALPTPSMNYLPCFWLHDKRHVFGPMMIRSKLCFMLQTILNSLFQLLPNVQYYFSNKCRRLKVLKTSGLNALGFFFFSFC